MLFSRTKPEAIVHEEPVEDPEKSTKRSEVEQFTQSIQHAPEEANEGYKERCKVDKWIFLTPGPSTKQQNLVTEIHDFADGVDRLRGLTESGEELDVILRAGFNNQDPDTFLRVEATLGTKDTVLEVRLLNFNF